MHRYMFALVVAAFSATLGQTHYNMLLPESAMVKKGDKVAFVYQWGHPFEHELFDAPVPEKVLVGMPDGKTQDLTKTLEKFKKPGIDGKQVDAFRFTFTPKERGDYWFVLKTPPIWMESEREFYEDVAQVMLHVETQNGWDRNPPDCKPPGALDFCMLPTTRPYGILTRMTFQAELYETVFSVPSGPQGAMRAVPRKRRIVEIERYNSEKPKEMPAEEFITFKTRIDSNGIFTCSLPDPGWWCMTAHCPAEDLATQGGPPTTRLHEGKMYPIRQRVTLWVHVDAKAASK